MVPAPSVDLALRPRAETGTRLVAWLGEQAMRFGAAFLGPRLHAVGSMAHSVLSNGVQHTSVISIWVGELSAGPETAESAEGLDSPLEADLPRLAVVSLTGLGHGRANQVVDEEVGPEFLAHHGRSLAA